MQKFYQIDVAKGLKLIVSKYHPFHFKRIYDIYAKKVDIQILQQMNKCKKYFTSSTLLTLYYCFLYPYLNYCNCIWGNTCKTYLYPLIKLQKMAMRIIEGAERSDHTEDIFKKLKVLNIDKLYVYCTQLLLFKYHYNKLPAIFDSFFTRNGVVHSIATRYNALFRACKAKNSLRLRTVRVAGVRIYNHFFSILDMNKL